jgi:hypothetical protein
MAFVGDGRSRDSASNRAPELVSSKVPAWTVLGSAVVSAQLGRILTPDIAGVVGEPFAESNRARGRTVGDNELRDEARELVAGHEHVAH